MRPRYGLLASLVTAFLLCVTTATAFKLLKNPVRRWFDIDLPRAVTVDNSTGLPGVDDGNGGRQAARDAIDDWDSPPGGSTIDLLNGSLGSLPAGGFSLTDGTSNLLLYDPFDVCTGSCLAATFVTNFDPDQTDACGDLTYSRYVDSDIIFNPTPGFSFGPFVGDIGWTSLGEDPDPDNEAQCDGEVYVETVTRHEVGHLLGLDHENKGNIVALMNSSIGSCIDLQPQADDIAGRDALYACNGGGGLPRGESCTSDNECASGRCRGPSNGKTCK